jgi:hypothetical protein
MTIGIVAVAGFSDASAGPEATITSTCRFTISAAIAGRRSGRPSAPRGSVTKFSPYT